MKTDSMMKKKAIKNYNDAMNSVLNEGWFVSRQGGVGAASTLSGGTRTYKGFSIGGQTPHPGRSITGTTGYDLPAIQRQEKEEHKAPALLPFPLDAAFDHISNIIFELDKLKSILKTVAENNTILSEDEVLKIQKMHSYAEKTIENFIQMGKIIERSNLNDDV